MTSSELQDVLDRVPGAVRAACAILDFATHRGGLTDVSEVSDCAADQLGEYTVYLTDEQFAEAYAAITRFVLDVFGFDRGASDGSEITDTMRAAVASGKRVRPLN